MADKRKWSYYNTKKPEPKFDTSNPKYVAYVKEHGAKAKKALALTKAIKNKMQ